MSVWLAALAGPLLVALSLSMMLRPAALQQVTQKFLADPPLVLISGALAMLGGLAIVNTHNIWHWDWRVVLTLLGWALLLGGALRVVAPDWMARGGAAFLDRPVATRIAGVAWFLLGCWLCWHGYTPL